MDVLIKVSAKSAMQLFRGCTPDYIVENCHGRCCRGSNGISVAIGASEEDRIASRGGVVINGLLQADRRGWCPFQQDDGLCALHSGDDKPLGCRVSPFTINNNNTLIVRNRYRLLRCFKGGTVPAYIAFHSSLEALFGSNALDIASRLSNGDGDLVYPIPHDKYVTIMENAQNRTSARVMA